MFVGSLKPKTTLLSQAFSLCHRDFRRLFRHHSGKSGHFVSEEKKKMKVKLTKVTGIDSISFACASNRLPDALGAFGFSGKL